MLNTPTAIQARATAGRVSARFVALMAPARFTLAIAVFALTTLLAIVAGAHDPLAAAGSWWMVSGTLIDLGCLLALSLLVRREGIRLLDLIQVDRSRIGREVLLGFGIVLLVVPALAINAALTVVFYGSKLPPQVALVHLPLWATVYSIVVWPVIWGFTEEMTYNGYLLPRLEVLTKRRAIAVAIVVVFWSLQHVALPFVPDTRYLIFRTLGAATVAISATVLYLFVTRRRLLPLIVAHWFIDTAAALSPVLLTHRLAAN